MAQLVLVPTPIGNLGDITLRALDVLKTADLIAAEDTRHSRKLLSHFDIHTPLTRLDAHTIAARGEAVLAEHHLVAFVTDAGTPGLSDPGVELVQLALARGDRVEVLPGATALIPALVLSGLPLRRFAFEGFLPRKGVERRERLQAIAHSPVTIALYESPKRVARTLDDLIAVCGAARQASVSRELSKRFETTHRGSLAALREALGDEVKGEIVVVVAAAEDTAAQPLELTQAAARLTAQGLSGRALRDALIALGASRNDAYTLSLSPSLAKDAE